MKPPTHRRGACGQHAPLHDRQRPALKRQRQRQQGGQREQGESDAQALPQTGLRQALPHTRQSLSPEHAAFQHHGQGGRVFGFVDGLEECFGRGDFRAVGFGAYREVADRLAALHDGRDVGRHPIVVAVLAAVLHHARPLAPAAYGAPQVLEGKRGHIGVAQDVVVGTHQLFKAVAAHVHEGVVAVGDIAACVGGGDDHGAVVPVVFLLGDRKV